MSPRAPGEAALPRYLQRRDDRAIVGLGAGTKVPGEPATASGWIAIPEVTKKTGTRNPKASPFTVFLALILLIRSGLVFVSERLAAARAAPERRSSTRESFAVAMYAATGLPIIVAVTSSVVSAGQMSRANASILVAGGGITVLACS